MNVHQKVDYSRLDMSIHIVHKKRSSSIDDFDKREIVIFILIQRFVLDSVVLNSLKEIISGLVSSHPIFVVRRA